MGAESQHALPMRQAAEANTDGVWLGPQQAAGLVRLAAEVPLRVLIGPQSSGKSTLLRHLKRVISDALVLTVEGPQETAAGVLAALLGAAGLAPADHSEIGRRNVLVALFEKLRFAGKRVILCIDDVSGFSPAAWKEVERLRLLRVADMPLLEIVVAATDDETAQPPLRSWLHEGSTSAIEATFCLSPPTDDEVAGYLTWKLARQRLGVRFAPDACQLINRLGLGRYGAINAFYQYLLLSVPRASLVDADMVRRATPSLAALRRRASAKSRLEPRRVDRNGKGNGNGSGNESVSDTQGYRLVVAFQDTVIREMELGGRVMIGSAEDSDLHLLGRFVNRHHALIVPMDEGTYYVADLNSEHGLAVNGKAVNHHVLTDGDVIGVGPFRLIVHLAAAGSNPITSKQPSANELQTA